MKTRWWLTVAVSAVASAAIWVLSPLLVGRQEPWDADGQFYLLALVVAGVIAGFVTPRPLWAHYLGAFVGQLAYEVSFLPMGPLLVLGIAFLLGYSVVFLMGAAVAGILRPRLGGGALHG